MFQQVHQSSSDILIKLPPARQHVEAVTSWPVCTTDAIASGHLSVATVTQSNLLYSHGTAHIRQQIFFQRAYCNRFNSEILEIVANRGQKSIVCEDTEFKSEGIGDL